MCQVSAWISLEGLLTDYSSGINYWIGCVQTDNNTCRWRDGIGHEFTDYNSQYVSVGGERCIELRGDENYKWEDARCDSENAFICQQGKVVIITTSSYKAHFTITPQ